MLKINVCFNYREFDLVGEPNRWYFSDQSLITLLRLVLRELDMVAMKN